MNLSHVGVDTAFSKLLLKERWKGQGSEEKDVSSYWITLRKRENTVNWKRKHYIALCGELVLEEFVDLL